MPISASKSVRASEPPRASGKRTTGRAMENGPSSTDSTRPTVFSSGPPTPPPLTGISRSERSGLSLKSAGPALDQIVIADVEENTPASAAELRPGDRIVSIDGRRPASRWDAQRALSAGPNRVVRLGIERGQARREVRLTLRRFV
jgi:membrane-associated protease RseP (regulator of RpoE activity)